LAKGEKLDDGGMLVDFSVLKIALKKVVSELDHSNLNDIAIFDNNPSAERIAKYIYDNLINELQESCPEGVEISAVDVFETNTSMARYIHEDEGSSNYADFRELR
jgi:6-pyruvoyltetrahydropterin/6-carboxytetrahydropterin synthase